MSVVNTMLRDLEARSDEQRKPKIPVRTPAPERRSSVLLVGAAVIAAAALAWQFLASYPQMFAGNDNTATPVVGVVARPAAVASTPMQTAPVQTAPTQSAAADVSPAQSATPAAAPAVESAPQASWQWSNDGFALQIDKAGAVRYGVERVDANTLKISLSHTVLPILDVPAPTPSWIETVRIQRDGEQQIVTVQTQSRLEYDIAMLDGGALVISAWRDANAAAAAVARADAVAAEEDPGAAQVAVKALPRPYEKPRIDRSTLTPSQRDERQAAEASTQLRAGQQSQAITLLRTALQSTDPAPRSAALLVTILMSQQRLQDAQPYLDRALQQMPQDATLVKLKARMLAMKGETERARNVLAPLSPATSSDPELLAMAASLAQQAHDFAAAAAYYLQWTHIDARSGAAWYGLALAFDAQASSSNAVSAYQHALSLISDARLRDYANTRIAALKGTSTPGNSNESVNTSAAVAR